MGGQDVLDDEFPACDEQGVGFVIGTPFQSGILAGVRKDARLDYEAPSAAA